MTTFTYKALDGSHAVVKGEVRAADAAEAVRKIASANLTPFEIHERAERRTLKKLSLVRSKTVKTEELMVAVRELSIMLRAGLPILRALRILIESNRENKIGEVFENIYEEAKRGESLASAMEKQKRVFSDFAVSMVKTGEKSGRLPDVLLNISRDLEQSLAIASEIRNALAYPAFLLMMSGVALIFMFVVVVPRFTVVIERLDVELPFYSRFIMSAGNFAKENALVILLAVIGLVLSMRSLAGHVRVRRAAHRGFLKLPLIKKIIQEIEISRFARALSILLQSGVEIIGSIRMAVSAIGNTHLRSRFSDVVDRIKKGESFHAAVRDIEFFPKIAVHMIQVGEETGTLPMILEEIALLFTEKFRNAMKRFIALLEPIIITGLGIVVGFIVISLLSAVMSLSDIRF